MVCPSPGILVMEKTDRKSFMNLDRAILLPSSALLRTDSFFTPESVAGDGNLIADFTTFIAHFIGIVGNLPYCLGTDSAMTHFVLPRRDNHNQHTRHFYYHR